MTNENIRENDSPEEKGENAVLHPSGSLPTEGVSPESTTEEKKSKKKKKSFRQALIRFIVKLGLIALGVFVVLQFIVAIRVTHTNDMYPFLNDGEFLLFSRVSNPVSGQIVLYRTEDGKEHIGRVMALEGDIVEIGEATGLIVNDNFVSVTVPYKTAPGDMLTYPLKVDEDSYFILNDYRERETDSRTYGCISRDDIVGVLIFTMQYRGL